MNDINLKLLNYKSHCPAFGFFKIILMDCLIQNINYRTLLLILEICPAVIEELHAKTA